jgi:hypothetical protein
MLLFVGCMPRGAAMSWSYPGRAARNLGAVRHSPHVMCERGALDDIDRLVR